MTKKDLIKKVAQLESVNDHLITELSYIDHLMRSVGFSGGLETVKLTAQELFEAEKDLLDFSGQNEMVGGGKPAISAGHPCDGCTRALSEMFKFQIRKRFVRSLG